MPEQSPTPTSPRVTERDMLGAMEVLATAGAEARELIVLTDEELEGIDGRGALDLLGGPYLAQDGIDRGASVAAAVRSLAARQLLRPLGDATEPEGDVITDGSTRPFQLERALAGVVTLRRIPEAMLLAQRTLEGGTTALGHYLFPAGGVLEEYVTTDGLHHLSVPLLEEIPERIARFADPFEDASEDGEVEDVTVPSPQVEERTAGARALTVLTSLAEGAGARVTLCARDGELLMLDEGMLDGDDTGSRTGRLAAVSTDTLRRAIAALVPLPADPGGSAEAADSEEPEGAAGPDASA